VLAIWCYGEMRFGDEKIDRALDHYYSDVVGPYWPPERKFVEEGYRTLLFPFSELEAPRFDLNAEFTLANLAGYLRTWSATQRYTKARGKDPVRDLETELQPLWPEGNIRRTKEWRIHIRVTRRM
jgi:hypothetical protein